MAMERPLKPIGLSRVREIVTALNRIDLARADYAYLRERISLLVKGFSLKASLVPVGTAFFRGIIYPQRPTHVSALSPPPPEIITNYQRCNCPGRPMFYAGMDIAAIFAEIDAKQGDKVYLSKWLVEKEFFYFRIPPIPASEIQNDPAWANIETFLETRFIHPIHETFSHQYKLTAAISQQFSNGAILIDGIEKSGPRLGAVAYPSVAHSSRSDNIAIQPSTVQDCLKLQDVREMYVVEHIGNSRKVQYLDFSANFDLGLINWAGRMPQWTIGPGEVVTFAVEQYEWVARKDNGSIVHPA